jgi:hypothetical protein
VLAGQRERGVGVGGEESGGQGPGDGSNLYEYSLILQVSPIRRFVKENSILEDVNLMGFLD